MLATSPPPTPLPTAVARATAESAIGPIRVEWTEAGICRIDLITERSRASESNDDTPLPAGWSTLLMEALQAGTPGDLPLDLSGVTPFRRAVLAATATIPRGQTRTYTWLAEAVGRPTAVRAAASAMATNPVPLVIPCHRVVRADGTIGQYSMGGPAMKRRLLDLESGA